MDLEKIGKFIAKKRQDNSYTQERLAEKLNISNRSISKWERGVCLPDANNIAKLCKLFDISYNELLSGEEINQKDYKQHSEKLLEEFSKIETLTNKKFFLYENVIGYMSTVSFLILCFIIQCFILNFYVNLKILMECFLTYLLYHITHRNLAGWYKLF